MILLPNPSHNLSSVFLLQPDIPDCRLTWVFSKLNSSWCTQQRERWLIRPYHACVSSCLMFSFYGRDTIWALLSVIRGLTIAVLPWTLDLWSSRRTAFVETGSSRWIFSSVVTYAAVVLWFFETIFLNVRRSLSLDVDFRPLFLFAEVAFPWFVYAGISLGTVALDTLNNVKDFVTDAPAKHAPIICPLKIENLPFSDSFARILSHSTQTLMHLHENNRV
jgi:hypothetical protein